MKSPSLAFSIPKPKSLIEQSSAGKRFDDSKFHSVDPFALLDVINKPKQQQQQHIPQAAASSQQQKQQRQHQNMFYDLVQDETSVATSPVLMSLSNSALNNMAANSATTTAPSTIHPSASSSQIGGSGKTGSVDPDKLADQLLSTIGSTKTPGLNLGNAHHDANEMDLDYPTDQQQQQQQDLAHAQEAAAAHSNVTVNVNGNGNQKNELLNDIYSLIFDEFTDPMAFGVGASGKNDLKHAKQ
ncbi:unnamed protein product [Ambrosiozyma monospora]|uniref:Unnamed protein product n=1 Tax=Ambrosiozyma monospora TaxID=43982 RepID=A0ACB5T282_AMBMO|nr:unnamed protein product [Ambrosiozyma monospora]